MFWNSVVGGLSMFTHWQTYVAIVEFLLISWVPMLVVGLVAANTGRAGGAIGCVSMLFLPLLQTFAVAVFVMTLSPIILGVSQEASWQLPWVLAGHDWWAAVKFLIIMLVIAVVFAMLPIIGRLQSFNLLILGSISLAVVLALIDRDNDGYVTAHVRFWPGFWFALGLFVVGATLAWVGMLASAMTGAWIDERWEGSGLLVAMPIGSVFGFLPLFIYGAWIAAQLHGR